MSSRILAGRYELLEKIGDGGMAVVYKAKDKLLNRFVAVKILKPEFIRDMKFIESFRRESQAAASLSHPNIVNVYDVGKEGNIHYIVMELVEGRVLSDVIRERGPLDVAWAVSIAKQVASALSLAHKNHIIHRDVKPHNILITQDGVAKITDFGIAKAVNSGTIVGNQQGMIMGSVHYFSPEQARGGYVDEKSDIYSLGIVMYEMLTGKVPFDADNPVTVAVMHMNNEITPPSELAPGIPPDVEAVVMKATNKYQVNRYRSADEMYEALEQANLNPGAPSRKASYGGSADMGATRVMPAAAVAAAAVGGRNAYAAQPEEEIRSGRGQGRSDYEDEDDYSDYGKKDRGSKGMGKTKKGGNQPKKKVRVNKVKLLAVILALVCAIPASAFLFHFVSGFGDGKDVIVPNLTDKTVEAATEELEALGLKIKIGDEVVSADIEAGHITSQDPVGDEKLPKGRSVTVNVSKGMEDDTIPDVTNKSLETASLLLKDNGYEIGETSEENSELAKGMVIRQFPVGGKKADAGTKVDLVVSLGKATEQIAVPDLYNKSKADASTELSANGLALGETSQEFSAEVEKGHVISQNPKKNSKVDEGTAVDIVISKGPDTSTNGGNNGNNGNGGGTTDNAGSVSINVPFDKASDEVFWVTITVNDEKGFSQPVNWDEQSKSKGSVTYTISGYGKGTIKVNFNNENVMTFNADFAAGTAS